MDASVGNGAPFLDSIRFSPDTVNVICRRNEDWLYIGRGLGKVS
jgi:hypothetical protein